MAHHAGVMVAIQGMFTAHRCPHGSREAGAPSPPYAASVMCCARWPLREEGLFSLSSLDHAAPQWILAKNGLGFFVDSLLKHRAGVADRAVCRLQATPRHRRWSSPRPQATGSSELPVPHHRCARSTASPGATE